MSEYVVSVITVAALISLALALAYKEGADGGGSVKVAFAVLLLYVTVTPLFGALKNFDVSTLKFDTGAHVYDEESAVAEVSEGAFCLGIRSFVAEEFSLDLGDVRVSAEGFDAANMSAEKIFVTLSGDAAYADFRAIREKLNKNGFEDCEVRVEIG